MGKMKRNKASLDTSDNGIGTEVASNNMKAKPKGFTTKRGQRKEQRKMERQLKKERKHYFLKNKKSISIDELKKAKEETKLAVEKTQRRSEKKKLQRRKERDARNKKRDEEKEREEEAKEKIEKEAKEIKTCEKLLHLNKRKNKSLPQSYIDDGLDYILNAVNPDWLNQQRAEGLQSDSEAEDAELPALEDYNSSDEDSSEDNARYEDYFDESDNDDDEDAPELVPVSSNKRRVHFSEDNDAEEAIEVSSSKKRSRRSCEEEQEEEQVNKRSKLSVDDSDDSDGEEVSMEEEDEESDDNNDEESDDNKAEESDDDDEEDNGKVYVPPHLKKAGQKDNDTSTPLEKIRKSLNSILNKVSNMQELSIEVQGVFANHSRTETTQALTDLILSVEESSYLVNYAMMVSILHANVGTEVGATFLQALVQKYDALWRGDSESYDETNRVNNLILILSALYNFNMIDSTLVFDIMDRMYERFKVKDVELLDLLLNEIGISLRKDHTVDLRKFLVKLQKKADVERESFGEDRKSLESMMDLVTNIRRNRFPDFDPKQFEHLKEQLRFYTKDNNKGTQQLSISLADLLAAEERGGKWWLVGSARQGPGIREPGQMGGEDVKKDETSPAPLFDASDELLQRAHKMAKKFKFDEASRSVYFSTFFALDVEDAYNKIMNLKKNDFEHEVVKVVTTVCLKHKTYNEFYPQLIGRLCENSREYTRQVTFVLWDQFKLIHKWKKGQINRLSKMLTYLIVTGKQSLAVLKDINGSDFKLPHFSQLLKETLLALLTEHPQEYIQCFIRIAKDKKLVLLRELLKLFIEMLILDPLRQSQKPVNGVSVEELERRINRCNLAIDSRGESI